MNRLKKRLIIFYYNLINIKGRLINKQPIVKSSDEAVDMIINKKVSVCRYGDGEFDVMNGGENGFQSKNELLANRLREIINQEDEKIIVCIPDVFGSLKKYRQESRSFWIEYLDLYKQRSKWLVCIKDIKNTVYYDTQMTRPYMMYKDKSNCKEKFDKLKKIWDEKELLIIEGEGSRLGVGNDLFDNARTIERIICPSKNAFDKYEEILESAKCYDKNKLILIALGMTATVLAHDLSKCGYQAIDIGHIDIEYEWFLRGATEKIKIENKSVNEVQGGHDISKEENLDYNNQIRIIIL